MERRFTTLANRTSAWVGHYASFGLACVLILAWLASGPVFDFSEGWQLVVNTATTIVTFLMVFLIQNTQNRDSAAIHVKLDELIRATDAADNRVMSVERQPVEDLAWLRNHMLDEGS